eukprot:6173772-Pleurochrysis_carterae.AAC.2
MFDRRPAGGYFRRSCDKRARSILADLGPQKGKASSFGTTMEPRRLTGLMLERGYSPTDFMLRHMSKRTGQVRSPDSGQRQGGAADTS